MMDDAFSEWLYREMTLRHWNQRELARRLDNSPSAVNRWLKGKGTPDTDSCSRLAKVLGMPVEVVYRAAGHPVSGEGEPEPPQPLRERVREVLAVLEASQPIEIPILEQLASAGMGDEILDYVYLSPPRAAGKNILGLRVHGNSMEPDLLDGDYIVVNKDLGPREGDMVLASIMGTMFVKWYRRHDGKPVLSSANGDMDARQAKIEGVVIQQGRNRR